MGKGNEKLPARLFERGGGFYYRRNRGEYFVGHDRRDAISQAAEANLHTGLCHGRHDPHAMIYSEELLNESDIARAAVPVSDLCGIYFLLLEERIVYVGQSFSCHRRIAEHAQQGGKLFTSFHILPCDQCDLDRFEALYIEKFQPAYNANVGPNAGWLDAKKAHAAKARKRGRSERFTEVLPNGEIVQRGQ
jgi:hypothetical protein